MHIIKTTETSLLQSQQEKLEKVALFFDESMPEGFGAIISQGAHSVDRNQMIQNTGQMINTKIAEIKIIIPRCTWVSMSISWMCFMTVPCALGRISP